MNPLTNEAIRLALIIGALIGATIGAVIMTYVNHRTLNGPKPRRHQ